MKKLMFFLFALFAVVSSNAQETLYANDTHVVTVFFPSPIRQAITGVEHFTFSYNRELGQHFGLLQANKGYDSNLLVITQDGRVYSYRLEYRKELSENSRFVTISEGIGWETETMVLQEPIDSIHIPKPIETSKSNPSIKLWEKGADYIIERKTGILKTERKKGLVLRLKEMFHHQNEVYLELELINRTEIDFEMDVLEIYKVNGKKGRRSSHQKVALEPKLKYDFPENVRVGQRQSFVYILPKFTLGNTEKLLVELHEKNGNRMLRLCHK